MRPSPSVPSLDHCPTCDALLALHAPGLCSCSREDCYERAAHRVATHARKRGSVLCDRHTRAAVVSAERFGYAVVITGVSTQPPLL